MSQFQLFDAVKLKNSISLAEGSIVVPEGTPGTIVEIFKDGEAYLVELFGDWVKVDATGDFIPADRDDSQSFMTTIGVETVSPQQIYLVKPACETVGVRAELLALMDELSEETLLEIKDFAEFLKQKYSKLARNAA